MKKQFRLLELLLNICKDYASWLPKQDIAMITIHANQRLSVQHKSFYFICKLLTTSFEKGYMAIAWSWNFIQGFSNDFPEENN